MDAQQMKIAAAREALSDIRNGMHLGLGTGSTASELVKLLGDAMKRGELRDLRCTSTSEQTAELARSVGIEILPLASVAPLDLAVDGADEIDARLRLIKGRGGALLREKIVATRSRRWIVVVDPTKLVAMLGTKMPLPIEVVRFGWAGHLAALRALGAEPARRQKDGETPYVTDEGNYLIDARFPSGISEPETLARELRSWPGVVETGLFLSMRPEIIVGEPR